MYHSLSSDQSSERYTLRFSEFEHQMRAIAEADIPVLTIDQLLPGCEAGGVVITFDDGHASNLDIAAPLLKELGFPATFFVTTGWIAKREGWMDWDDLGKLQAMGMDVQAHGHTHRFFNELPRDQLMLELRDPIELIEKNSGLQVRHLSLPGGRCSDETIKLARTCGYKSIATSIPGINNIGPGSMPRFLKRYTIHQDVGQQDFRKILDGDRRFARRMETRYRITEKCRGILGNSLYHLLWSRLRKTV